MASSWHSAGYVFAGACATRPGFQPITLTKARDGYLLLKREALKARATDHILSVLLDDEARALALAHDACAAYRRAAGWADPYAVDRSVAREVHIALGQGDH